MRNIIFGRPLCQGATLARVNFARYRIQLWIQDSRNFLRSVADDMGVKLSANVGGVKLSDVRSVKLSWYQPWGYHSQSDNVSLEHTLLGLCASLFLAHLLEILEMTSQPIQSLVTVSS